MQQEINIGKIPAILWGDRSEKLYIFVHGQNGNKEEAQRLSSIVCAKGWQVLSFDLPEHGARTSEHDAFNPWTIVPELQQVMEYAKPRWRTRALYANSIGAWLCMQSFKNEVFERCLLVSPILDMHRLIHNMMTWAGVSAERLKKEENIVTDFGQTLSWEYFDYAQNNPIGCWESPTHILYAAKDNLTERCVVDEFVQKFNCELTVLTDCEHWIHTPLQLAALDDWVRENCDK